MMNTTIFTEKLVECRKRKYSSQQAFADAYMERFGLIRQGKKSIDNNMFGTIQKWEQGKSEPTASVLANICDLLECDADYLLGRISERTHDIYDAQLYTGLSSAALEQLHEYRENLLVQPDPEEIYELQEDWTSHKFYQSFALFLIDELLVGSQNHHLSAYVLDTLYSKIVENGFYVKSTDYISEDDSDDCTEEDRIKWAARDHREIDIAAFHITNNVRDIIVENAIQNKLPPALYVDQSKDCYVLTIKK
ncbi:MAG: helix-turn-helix domain-containing protein [Velocimicrobium sp.]